MLTAWIKRGRDPRLDFFRGLSLLIILIDHMRGNALTQWTLGQFGLSDAACIFIFVSGYSAALAFGPVFERAGWWLGTARVALRVWQLYVAQLAIVMAVAALPGFLHRVLGVNGYTSILELDYLFVHPQEALWGIVSLTYVPPYLDILPVYIVLMGMVPLVVLLGRLDRRLLFGASFLLWLAARKYGWNLQADPETGRAWFFNPFAWQFLFFTGFGLRMGWFRPPHPAGTLRWVAVAFLVLCAALRMEPIYTALPRFALLHDWVIANTDKSQLDPLIYVHFLVLAYIAVPLFSSRRLAGPWALPLVMVGQQSLAVFLAIVLLADLGGAAFDHLGTGLRWQLLVNSAAFAAALGVGWAAAWFKAAPWRTARIAAPSPGTMVAAE